MYSRTPPSKRPHEGSSIERSRKTPFKVLKIEDVTEEKLFQFRILLPNATTIELKMPDVRNKIPIEEFIDVVSQEYRITLKQRRSQKPKTGINWEYQDLHFTDVDGNKMRLEVDLRNFKPDEWHFLRLHDGSADPDVHECMWDLTPDTDLLRELPDDYTFETALADLIDNSLQALWSNTERERRLISVDLRQCKISIFDSGPGMDGAGGNLVKWGKMGASLHRSVRERAIGGEPPYLKPFFGMFGYGGPVATMCLGRHAVVSSKTQKCKKVFTLHLEREALVSASSSENCWKAKGGIRDPSKDEIEKSPHRSFMKVEIFEPKVKTLDIKRFRCKLKDIYFPYIQCDEMSGKTSTPIEFEVNGINLAGIQGGEVATTNLHSCHGPDFILQLHFSINKDPSSMSGQSQGVLLEANARLKCVYFPIVEGEESIIKILDKLDANGCGIGESFESFSRVSVRRLGRLLPETRWSLLPFMEPKQKKGEKGHNLKRNCSRVKCFIDTDSGFNPTPHKTDLAQHHPYTKALKNFGKRTPENEKEVQVEILRDGKKLTLTELEKQYNEWVSEMHNRYDDEVYGGLDQPTIVVDSSNNKKLDLTADVLRVHKKIQRKGKVWAADENIKVLKGACPGCHKSNVFATLEYIILEGIRGDPCGEARLICRPLGIPKDRGCRISVENGSNTIDIRDSLALPIRVIDCGKCTHVDDIEWGKKLEVHNQKLPSSIELLSDIDCQKLEIEGGFPTLVQAGDAPPENIVAVIRPMSYNVEKCSNRLDQKFIVRDDLSLSMEIKCRASEDSSGEFALNHYSVRLSPSSEKGLHGLYLLPLRMKQPDIFQKAGFFTFSFYLKEPRDIRLEQVVEVRASAERGRWKVKNYNKNELYSVRVGSCSKPLSIVCCDKYNNHVQFASVPELTTKLSSHGIVLGEVRIMKVDVTPDKSTLRIKELLFKSSQLDGIQPHYEAILKISRADEAFSIDLPCRVIPGSPEKITLHPPKLRKKLIPGEIIEKFELEVFDEYGNHVKEDEIISLRVNGLSVQDESGVHVMGPDFMKKVNAQGFIDLSNSLKVSKGYGKDVHLSVISKERVIFKMQFHTETREMRSVQKVFRNCEAGSQLENIVFEITDSEGKVDESIQGEDKYGHFHSLTIKSDSFDVDDTVRYGFRNGRCTIRSIPLPQREGIFCFSAVHSLYPELNSVIEVHVENARQENHDSRTNLEDIENLVFSSRTSSGNERALLHSPLSNVSEETRETFSPQSPRELASPISSKLVKCTPKKENTNRQFENSSISRRQASAAAHDLGNLTGSASVSGKELEEDLLNSGMAVNNHESKLKILKETHSLIQQPSIDREVGNTSSPSPAESTMRQIQRKSGSAAAVICNIPFRSMSQDVVGVVALLGTVDSFELSKMLALYIGEDQMLAIVCRNYTAAYHLETSTLQRFATEIGQTIKGGFHAVCLEDIRENSSYLHHLEAPPTLPNGNVPQGFLGYAVKLINIAASYLKWKTKRGLDLRETLFYRLFGELHVYRDRESMMGAQSCIKGGAVSLDGGIMRGNGVISLGHWEPEILFPVINKRLSLRSMRNLQLLEGKRAELEQINKQIDEENDAKERANKSFFSSRDKYNDYQSRIGKKA